VSTTWTSKKRLLAALSGRPVDHVPVFLHIPVHPVGDTFIPAPIHGSAEPELWRQEDPAYRRLAGRIYNYCDHLYWWRPQCLHNESFWIPKSRCVVRKDKQGTKTVTETDVALKDRTLRKVVSAEEGVGYSWVIEPFCKTVDDAKALFAREWERVEAGVEDFFELSELLGDHGLMWICIPSPIMTVCRLFDPSEFLLFTHTDREFIHEMLSEAARRIEKQLACLLEMGIGPVYRFLGAEHATPPLMGPKDFEDFVVRYDQPLIERVKKHGHFVGVHCHGNIRYVLGRFAEIGVDQLDPVEVLPDGDLTIEEARRIAGDSLTITGNIQFRELLEFTPEQMKQRVKDLIRAAGPRRLIVSTTAVPAGPFSSGLEANYNTLIDTVLSYG
jgi:uroporphyrinogen-III decarboxylase